MTPTQVEAWNAMEPAERNAMILRRGNGKVFWKLLNAC